MILTINGKPEELPEAVKTVEQLSQHLRLPEGGTAIAVNGKLARKEQWGATMLHENDNVMIISAAYGG